MTPLYGGESIANFDPSSRNVSDDSIKLYRYINRKHADDTQPPSGHSYTTGLTQRLHQTNTIIVDGEIRQIDYFVNAVGPDAEGNFAYSDLVVRENFVYVRDATGFARARTQTITWYREDGTPHPDVKTRVKYYENDESLREGQRRRRNITDTLSMTVTGWLMQTQTQVPAGQARIDMGRAFMRFHKTSFDMYVDASSAQVLYDIRDETQHAWLNEYIAAGVTVRAYVLGKLNIWGITL